MKHGLAHKHPLYGRWVGMRQRCNDKNHPAYSRYGGLGLGVCDRWADFEVFLEDMGSCPQGMTLERKDNSKGYTPENCVWASKDTQARNRSMTVWIEFGGKTMCLSDWAKEIGISFSALKERLSKYDVALALTAPKQVNNGQKLNKLRKSNAAI